MNIEIVKSDGFYSIYDISRNKENPEILLTTKSPLELISWFAEELNIRERQQIRA